MVSRTGKPKIHCTGMADIEAGIATTALTRFELASFSKTIASTVIMRLFEQGEVDLQEPAGPLIGISCTNKSARPVTLRDLLQHTSGLPNYLENGGRTPVEELKRSYVASQLPRWFAAASPGVSFDYSNTNYVALALIVEAATGQPYAAHTGALFKTLGMRNTGSVVHPEEQPLELAIGYGNRGCGVANFDRTPHVDIDTEGDGGVFSCVSDLLTWQQAFWSEKIVGDETIELMIRAGRTDDGQSFPYGLGLQVETSTTEGRWFGHGGSWLNSTTLVGHYPDADTSVVVLSNEAMAPVERISQRAIRLLQWAWRTGAC